MGPRPSQASLLGCFPTKTSEWAPIFHPSAALLSPALQFQEQPGGGTNISLILNSQHLKPLPVTPQPSPLP